MVRTLLRELRRRWMIQAFAETWVFLAFAALLIEGVVLLWPGSPYAGQWVPGLFWGLGVSALLALILVWWRRPSLEEVAVRIDRLAATRDRFSTALAFEAIGAPDPLHRAALAECERTLREFETARWTPWRLPRLAPWLALALMLVLIGGPAARWWLPVPPPPDAETLATARQLEAIARDLAAAPDASEALKRVAEAMKKSAHQLKAEAEGDQAHQARKATLRELSSLEAMVEAVRQAAETRPMEEMAEALAQAEATRKAAEALKQGDAKAAAEALDELARQLKENQQDEGLAKAMEEAARRAGAGSQAGNAARRVAQALRQGAGAQEAMRQLAQAMRQSSSGGQQGEGENSSRQQALSAMANALREMKTGEGNQGNQGSGGQPGQPGGQQGGEGGSGVMMVEAPGGEPSGLASAQGDGASGQPGSERDEGSKAGALGEKPVEPVGKTGFAAQMEGLLGQGETLQTLVATPSGEGKATVNYSSVYEAAIPSAQDALEREQIPLGSRLLIKRYFESIRPEP